MRIPAHLLQGIVCFGRVALTSPLLGFCMENAITISYLTATGKFLARVEGALSGNILLRRAQYAKSEQEEEKVNISRHFLVGKLHNQRTVLRRTLRDHSEKLVEESKFKLDKASKHLTRIIRELIQSYNLETLRGLEGEAAQIYFSVFNHLILVNNPVFLFTGRNRRPPKDAINALLSFLYTVLAHDCRSSLESVGLDSAAGYLHQDRPGRPSLALDLLEEFRPVLADRVALSLINRKQLDKSDFQHIDGDTVLLKAESRKQKKSFNSFSRKKERGITAYIFKRKSRVRVVPLNSIKITCSIFKR